MKRTQKLLGIGALTLILSGCGYEPKYLEGKVTEESGTLVNPVELSSTIDKDHIKFGGPSYILTIETSEGEYIINVWGGMFYKKNLADLAKAIEVGDKVRFKTNYMSFNGIKPYFSRDRIGSVPSDKIEIIEKAKE